MVHSQERHTLNKNNRSQLLPSVQEQKKGRRDEDRIQRVSSESFQVRAKEVSPSPSRKV